VSAEVLAGRELAAQIRARVAEAIAAWAGPAGATPPSLAVVSATADEASGWYVRSIASAAGKVGLGCDVVDLGPEASVAAIGGTLRELGASSSVHGIILATPLPGGARLAELAELIPAAKDVDGASPLSLGRIAAGLPAFAPATAEAVLRLLDVDPAVAEVARALSPVPGGVGPVTTALLLEHTVAAALSQPTV
jgi:methylenetetrahydrofolate dehydrogenase (NADP+)/methenyltetrahydrofolate cyclohydrolase